MGSTSVPIYPPPPPPTTQSQAAKQLGMAGAAAILGQVAGQGAVSSYAAPHFGQVMPASFRTVQSVSGAAVAGMSVNRLIEVLAIVFLAGGVVTLLLALLPRLCLRKHSVQAGDTLPPQLPMPWLLAVALVLSLLALIPALSGFTAPSLTLILVSLAAVLIDYTWVVRVVCAGR